MYLIYCKTDGSIFREVDNIKLEGTDLKAGVNGNYTITYPEAVNADYIEVTQEQVNNLGEDYSKFLVIEGEIVENPNWAPFISSDYMEGYEQALLDLTEAGE